VSQAIAGCQVPSDRLQRMGESGAAAASAPPVAPAMGSRLAIAQRCWLTPDLARQGPPERAYGALRAARHWRGPALT